MKFTVFSNFPNNCEKILDILPMDAPIKELLALFNPLISSKIICAAARSSGEENGARVLEKTISVFLNHGNEQLALNEIVAVG